MSERPDNQLPQPFLRTVGFAEPATPVPGLEGATIGDFWRWAYSDLTDNSLRGVFAEYLVASALDAAHEPRSSWDAYDVLYQGAHRIEVKAAGDVQAWAPPKQRRAPTFGIGPRLAWDESTALFSDAPLWSAELYVFCHHRAAEPNPMLVVDTELWDFYVVATAVLQQRPPDRQKSIGLRAIQTLCREGDACQVALADLRLAVDRTLGLSS